MCVKLNEFWMNVHGTIYIYKCTQQNIMELSHIIGLKIFMFHSYPNQHQQTRTKKMCLELENEGQEQQKILHSKKMIS